MLSLHPHIYAVKIFLHNTYLASREQRIKNEHTHASYRISDRLNDIDTFYTTVWQCVSVLIFLSRCQVRGREVASVCVYIV